MLFLAFNCFNHKHSLHCFDHAEFCFLIELRLVTIPVDSKWKKSIKLIARKLQWIRLSVACSYQLHTCTNECNPFQFTAIAQLLMSEVEQCIELSRAIFVQLNCTVRIRTHTSCCPSFSLSVLFVRGFVCLSDIEDDFYCLFRAPHCISTHIQLNITSIFQSTLTRNRQKPTVFKH